MKRYIEGLITLLFYDGPVEFVGQTQIQEGLWTSVFGFYTDDVDGDRVYTVWGRTPDGMSMQSLGTYTYNEIDWTHLDK